MDDALADALLAETLPTAAGDAALGDGHQLELLLLLPDGGCAPAPAVDAELAELYRLVSSGQYERALTSRVASLLSLLEFPTRKELAERFTQFLGIAPDLRTQQLRQLQVLLLGVTCLYHHVHFSLLFLPGC